jgi:serine/threonine protein kinase
LGQGGYGTCLLARDDSKKVALKVCYCEPDKPHKKALIEAEAAMASSLKHKYVVHVQESFDVQDLTILVQDWCEGGGKLTLNQYLPSPQTYMHSPC